MPATDVNSQPSGLRRAAFRVCYAANRVDAAALESFSGRMITASGGELQLVCLEGSPAVLHLS